MNDSESRQRQGRRLRALRTHLTQARMDLARTQMQLDVAHHERDLARRDQLVLCQELETFRQCRAIRLREWLRARLRRLPLFSRLFRPGPPPSSAPLPMAPVQPLQNHKQAATKLAQVALQGFLSTRGRLSIPRAERPAVSVILVLYNRAELTFGCLQSILANTQTGMEIILVDNASQDDTGHLLERLDGARVIRNQTNLGFPAAVNQGAQVARGDYLLLLNNDTQLLGPGIDVGKDYLDQEKGVGAVGGKILLLDGGLQEAGGILWQEACTSFNGRGQSPQASAYQVRRDVDYCSGAYLMVRRTLFEQAGGLDEVYSPGYYEDVQLCLRLWQMGARVTYLPEIAVLHYENASSDQGGPHALVERNQQIFLEKNRSWLLHQPSIRQVDPHFASFTQDARPRVLVVLPGLQDMATPLVQALLSLNCFVTVLLEPGRQVASTFDQAVEWACPDDQDSLTAWINRRAGFYLLAMSFGQPPAALADPIWRRVTRHVEAAKGPASWPDWCRDQLTSAGIGLRRSA